MNRPGRSLVTALLFGLAAAARPARAAPAVRPAIRVAPPACATSPVPFDAFVASLRVELAGHDLPCCEIKAAQKPVSAATLQVGLTVEPCAAAAAGVVATVTDPSNGRVVHRPISLADVSLDARPRALALAVAELIRSLQEAPEPARVAAIVTPSPQPATPAAASRSWAVAADGVLRLFPARHTSLFGGALTTSLASLGTFAALDLGAAFGGPSFTEGAIAVRSASAGVTAGWRWSGRKLSADLGLRGELGWASVAGQASRAGVQMGSGSGVTGAAGLRLAVGAPRSSLRLHALLDAGLILRGVRGDVNGAPGAGVGGPYVLLGLGASLAARGESP